jgi:hypothetical protein
LALPKNLALPKTATPSENVHVTRPSFGELRLTLYFMAMRQMLRFLWNSTRGHRIAPWRSPYLLWRMETYTGVKMTQIGFLEFWEFMWIERASLWRFLKWTAEMDRYVHPKAKSS